MKSSCISNIRPLAAGLLILLAAALLSPAALAAGKSAINADEDGNAVKGFDVVAYFTDGRPVKGQAEFSYDWKGARWLFASREHLEMFKKAPERYAPQYGGYWAWAASRGYTADIDPEAWTIHEGRLYLNFSKKVRKKWSRDIPGNIEKADRNWPGILEK